MSVAQAKVTENRGMRVGHHRNSEEQGSEQLLIMYIIRKGKIMSNEKRAYQVILSPEEEGGYFVTIPDMDISTQGENIADAIDMARDAIGLKGITLQDMGKDIPEPGTVKFEVENNDILTYVDINFSDYRKKVDNKAVKKNCTIPYWMSVEAEQAGINYSKLLQDAIVSALGLKSKV